MSTSDISSLIAQLKALKLHPPRDERLRQELYDTARDLSFSLEDPQDTIYRIAYSPLQLNIAKIAADLKVFEMLVKKGSPLTTTEISELTKSDAILLGRVLRYLASMGMIKEVGEDTFAATNISEALSNPGFEAGLRHNVNAVQPCWQVLPSFLSDTKYANPSQITNTPFQRAHKTEEPVFVWAMSQPQLLQNFNLWMTATHEKQTSWLDVFSMEQLYGQEMSNSTVPLFVDIGGGIGHQCAALRARFPSMKSRVILQDLPFAIEHALPTEGVENTVLDFWGEQPIKGAKIYYLRNILHDHPDAKCVELLRNTMAAMTKDSVILIDDMVIPNTGAHWHATQLDLTMMSSLASMERSEQQWQALLEDGGLHIREMLPYTSKTRDSLIVAVPK